MTPSVAASLSFNEVEALAAKAARGSGLGWGHAEDLGRAARWLAERGLDWSSPLLHLLDDADAPGRIGHTVQAADRASSAVPGEGWTLPPEADAIYAVPLLAAAIYRRAVGVILRWPTLTLHLRPEGEASADRVGCGLSDWQASLAIDAQADLRPLRHPLRRESRPGPLSPARLALLSAYAAKTTVPASAASRALGAGSTRSDND